MEKHRNNTYHRIIDASLALFNQEGERNITTNHIAAYLGISPGNLYYHFRNKDDIILPIFQRYMTSLVDYLKDTPPPATPEALKSCIAGLYDVMWEYRFLFSDVNNLLARNEVFLEKYNEFTHRHVSPLLQRFLLEMNHNGLMDIAEDALYPLSISLWLVTKYWFDFYASMNERALSKEVKQSGVAQTMSLLTPYYAKR